MALVPFPGKKPSSHAAARDDEIEPYNDEYADRPSDTEGARMSFLEHLDELRQRIFVAVASLFVGFVIALIFIDRIVEFIMRPLQQTLPPGGKLIYTEPSEAFFLYMKMAALAGLIVAAPVILWQVWQFIAPGLYANEKRYAIPFVVFATVFFITGALFSHYVAFPWTFIFFASFAVGTDYLEFTPRIDPIFALYTKMLLSFGVIFQMPTFVYFLARVGVVTPRFLIKNAKYAILIIFIAAAILSPGGDVVSQAMMAGPMLILYGISIGIAWVFARKPKPESELDS